MAVEVLPLHGLEADMPPSTVITAPFKTEIGGGEAGGPGQIDDREGLEVPGVGEVLGPKRMAGQRRVCHRVSMPDGVESS
jgi:hypothetical protein